MLNGTIGYLIVDNHSAWYPLIIYPYSRTSSEKKPSRKSALDHVIDDLNKKMNNIIDLFDGFEEWNNDLQNQLQSIFEYPSEKEI